MFKIFNLYFIYFFLLANLSFSNENKVYYLDINFLLNNSNIGKNLINELNDKNKNLDLKFSQEEKKLEDQKNEILSQQNILEKKDFENKVLNHQKNVQDYQNKKKNDLDELRKIRMEKTNQLLALIDKILLEFSKVEKIDMIFKKESLIISNEKFDITNKILDILNKK